MSRLPDRIRRTLRARAVGGPSSPASAPDPEQTATGDSGPTPGAVSLPAGEDPADERPTALRRGRLRKRLRYLERRRELMLRDLGGLVFELHRTGDGGDREHQRSLVSAKVARIAEADAELAAGRAQLGAQRGDLLLREPGVGGLCPNCGEVHGSDARFCPACGIGVAGSAGERLTGRGAEGPLTDPVLPDPVVAADAGGRRSPDEDAHASESPTRVVSPGDARASSATEADAGSTGAVGGAPRDEGVTAGPARPDDSPTTARAGGDDPDAAGHDVGPAAADRADTGTGDEPGAGNPTGAGTADDQSRAEDRAGPDTAERDEAAGASPSAGDTGGERATGSPRTSEQRAG